MGKEARLRHERRLARTPPPVGKKPVAITRRIWLATGALAAVAACAVAVLLVSGGGSSPPPPAANASALDATASPQLVAEANKVGFKPHGARRRRDREPTGLRGAAADQHRPPPRRSSSPGFALSTPTGRNVTSRTSAARRSCSSSSPRGVPTAKRKPRTSTSSRAHSARSATPSSRSTATPRTRRASSVRALLGLPFPALLDPGGTPGSFESPGSAGVSTTKYGLQAFPTFYVVAPNGKITWRSDGEQPTALLRQELERATADAA